MTSTASRKTVRSPFGESFSIVSRIDEVFATKATPYGTN